MKKRKPERWFFLLCSIISVLLITFPMFFLPLSRSVFTVTSFFQLQVSRMLGAVQDALLTNRRFHDLRNEHEAFLEAYAQSLQEKKEYNQLLQENMRLRELLDYSYDITPRYYVARIASVGTQSGGIAIQLDLGSFHGIREHAAVVAPHQGRLVLVGTVQKVGARSSVVAPLSDPYSRIAVRLQDLGYDGLLSGTGEHIVMQYVDLEARPFIQVGHTVVSALSSSLVPPDIYIGQVKNIIRKSHELTLELEIEPFVFFRNFEYVFVVLMDRHD